MAAVYFRHLCAEYGLTGVCIESAGVAAVEGEPISRQAALALAEEGLDGRRERSSSVSRDRVDWASLIVVMTTAHKRSLLSMFPGVEGKTITLMSVAGDGSDVSDPFGGTLDVYTACLAQMQTALAALAQRLLRPPSGACGS